MFRFISATVVYHSDTRLGPLRPTEESRTKHLELFSLACLKFVKISHSPTWLLQRIKTLNMTYGHFACP
eukprot:m.68858 g.68858  ORF g.68858 m.68858 type:complete len:69 (+) comp9941_c0_seq2:5023-5229(+)